jgi:hypothetical protein
MYPEDEESLCVDDPTPPEIDQGPSQETLTRRKYEDWWKAAWEDHINMYGDHTLR